MAYTYTAESIPEDLLKALINDEWENDANLPKPTIEVVNDPEDPFARFDISDSDVLIIRSEGTEQVKYRGNISYYDRVYGLTIEFRSAVSRQRVRDIWKMLKGIFFDNKHDFEGWQLIRILGYQEEVNQSLNIWQGIVRIQLESNGVSVETNA